MLTNLFTRLLYFSPDVGGGGGQQDPPAGDGADKNSGDGPAAPQQEEGAAAPAGQGGQQEERIRDPEAWAKAQVGKEQRLREKREAEIAQLKTQIKSMEEAQAKAIGERIAALEKESGEREAEIKADLIQARREKAVMAAGLPESAAEFITGETDEDIAAQVERLQTIAPQRGEGGAKKPPMRQPQPGNPGSTRGLTLDEIKAMSQDEVIRRYAEVQEALKKHR